MNNEFDLVIIGAGPTGLATALEARRLGLRYLVLDKGCVVESIFRFTAQMTFFTTPELLEIGTHPMVCTGEKPTRIEALKYYRRIVQTQELNVHQYEEVSKISKNDSGFVVETPKSNYQTGSIVIATGYYDNPNMIGIPGEDLPHVAHYYTEAHSFFDRDVVVIGGQNSAAEAALELFRAGAHVTLIHRRQELGKSLKYWVRPDILNRIDRKEIAAYLNATVEEIFPGRVRLRQGEKSIELAADQVFALTGYQPDTTFFDQLGVEYDADILLPTHNPDTFETNVEGVFIAGSIVAGKRHKEIFIENGRFHGQAVVQAIAAKQ